MTGQHTLQDKHILIIGSDQQSEEYAVQLQIAAGRVIRLNEDVNFASQAFMNNVARSLITSGAQVDAVVVVNPHMQKQMGEGFNEQPLIKFAAALKGLKKPVIIFDPGNISDPVKTYLTSIDTSYHDSDEMRPDRIVSVVFDTITNINRDKGKPEGRV